MSLQRTDLRWGVPNVLAASALAKPSSAHQPHGELCFEEVGFKGFRRQMVVMEKKAQTLEL